MSKRLWLLVEWLDYNSILSNYDVINVDSLIGNQTNFDIGKTIFVPCKRTRDVRQGKILRVSDNKSHVKELQMILEKQDAQVKNVISICMNTIKHMKSNSTKYIGQQPICTADVPSPPHRSSSEDSETLEQNLKFNEVTTRYIAKIRTEPTTSRNVVLAGLQTPYSSREPLIGSTPVLQDPKLMFDKATQTDPTDDADAEKLEELEATAKALYQRFLSLVEQIEKNESGSKDSYDTDSSELDEEFEEHSGKEESDPDAFVNTSENELPLLDKEKQSSKKLCIRRASAHTTNCGILNPPDVDMVPIGLGNAQVPSNLMDVIDWSSHTTATRQLLQAIFPRSVLATHSLTGKQSPAFTNKPPKKRLDPELVEDIVDTVSERCGVSKRTVRSCITTKCTDEAKLYRNRLQCRQSNDSRDDQENLMPSSPSAASFPKETSVKKE